MNRLQKWYYNWLMKYYIKQSLYIIAKMLKESLVTKVYTNLDVKLGKLNDKMLRVGEKLHPRFIDRFNANEKLEKKASKPKKLKLKKQLKKQVKKRNKK